MGSNLVGRMDESFKRKRADLENMVSTPPSSFRTVMQKKLCTKITRENTEKKHQFPLSLAVVVEKRRKAQAFVNRKIFVIMIFRYDGSLSH